MLHHARVNARKRGKKEDLYCKRAGTIKKREKGDVMWGK
jgi:hypothetical protein